MQETDWLSDMPLALYRFCRAVPAPLAPSSAGTVPPPTPGPLPLSPPPPAAPCEDEIASCVLSHGASPYMALAFLRRFRTFLPYQTFDVAAGAAAFPRWRDAFTHFCRKVLYDAARRAPAGTPPRLLLLKSPVHTARMALLLRLFPGARFVFVHRHPHTVFQSSIALVTRQFPHVGLAGWSAADAAAYILDLNAATMAAYLADRPAVAAVPGRLVEVAFDDLVTDPAGALAAVYRGLGLEGLDVLRGVHARAAADVTAYQAGGKMNVHPPLSAAAVAAVNTSWRDQFEVFGYMEEPPAPKEAGGGWRVVPR